MHSSKLTNHQIRGSTVTPSTFFDPMHRRYPGMVSRSECDIPFWLVRCSGLAYTMFYCGKTCQLIADVRGTCPSRARHCYHCIEGSSRQDQLNRARVASKNGWASTTRQMVADGPVGQTLSSTIKRSDRADAFRQMVADDIAVTTHR